jgi:hypothetical protein
VNKDFLNLKLGLHMIPVYSRFRINMFGLHMIPVYSRFRINMFQCICILVFTVVSLLRIDPDKYGFCVHYTSYKP